MFSLDGKVAVIIGGNGILGKHFCKALLEHGAVVYSCDVNISEDDFLVSFASKYQSSFFLKKINATKKTELEEVYKEILINHQKVDVLINATTFKGKDFFKPFEEASLEGWEMGLKGNLTTTFLATQTFVPIMRERMQGSIINISSIYGIVGNDQRIYEGSNLHEIYVKDSPNIKQIFSHGVYNAAKGGLNGFTRYLAAYYGKYNIRVNAISPGGVYFPGENETFVKKYNAKVPLGRKAQPDEVNGALIYLASDASSYVTGHNLIVDGGFSIW